MQIFDSRGVAHSINIDFANVGPGAWTYHVLANGAEVVDATAGLNAELATGNLAFNTNGALASNVIIAGGTVSFNGATPMQPFTFDFGAPTGAGATGFNGITDFGGASVVSVLSQDGHGCGPGAEGAPPCPPTTVVAVQGNVNATDPTPAIPWTLSGPFVASSAEAVTNISDVSGQTHILFTFLASQGGGLWTYHGLVQGADVGGALVERADRGWERHVLG